MNATARDYAVVRSPELIAEAKRLRAGGLSYRRIGNAIGVSIATAFYWANWPDDDSARVPCECGCGEIAPLGKDGQPLPHLPGHASRKASAPASGYTVDAESGCWVWQLKRTKFGYGRIQKGGRGLMAHRWFYEQAKGPIPEGLDLDHLCRNPSCVNPDHLEPVTRLENAHRSRATKLTADDVLAIRASTDKGVVLAERYGVRESQISRIRARLTWRHLP